MPSRPLDDRSVEQRELATEFAQRQFKSGPVTRTHYHTRKPSIPACPSAVTPPNHSAACHPGLACTIHARARDRPPCDGTGSPCAASWLPAVHGCACCFCVPAARPHLSERAPTSLTHHDATAPLPARCCCGSDARQCDAMLLLRIRCPPARCNALAADQMPASAMQCSCCESWCPAHERSSSKWAPITPSKSVRRSIFGCSRMRGKAFEMMAWMPGLWMCHRR